MSGWWHTQSLRLNSNAGIDAYESNFFCLHFALLDAGVFNSLEEFCIKWVATVIFIRPSAQPSKQTGRNVYNVIHRQTVSLYLNSSVWLDTWDTPSRDTIFVLFYFLYIVLFLLFVHFHPLFPSFFSVWFDLMKFLCFNGIETFVGYLMSKLLS